MLFRVFLFAHLEVGLYNVLEYTAINIPSHSEILRRYFFTDIKSQRWTEQKFLTEIDNS